MHPVFLTIRLVFAFLITSLTIISIAHADPNFQCALRSTNCQGTETCWFTQSAETDAHISDCSNDPYNYKMCCTLTQTVAMRSGSCPIGESQIISISQTIGDAHVANYLDPFTSNLCAQPVDGVFDVLYQTTSPPTEQEYICVTSLSQQADAHVSKCSDPYNLKLYVRSRRAVIENGTINVQLNVKDTDNKVAIQSQKDKTLSDLQDGQYAASYSISYGQGKAVGVVAANRRADNKIDASHVSGVQHSLKLTGPQDGNKIYLVFTLGDGSEIKERFDLVEDGTFEDQANPSFGRGLEDIFLVKIGSSYGNSIKINDSDVLQAGTYRIKIEKLGKNETTDANIVGVVTE